ncbi:MAG: hypothetical protein RLZZ488_456 [Pseudomonadota bacterium]|jgi:uncharacterized protein YyaL (SSP411 family)
MSTGAQKANLLQSTQSLYLRQFVAQSVHWFPWCDAALASAQAEKKPIFLSIGHSNSPLCEEMAGEVFEDDETVDFLNRNFVCINVDSAERPDLADVCREIVEVMNDAAAAFPLSVFLTEDLLPIFSGGYFPLETTAAKPSFLHVCRSVLAEIEHDMPSVTRRAEALLRTLRSSAEQNGVRSAERLLGDTSLTSDSVCRFLIHSIKRMDVDLGAWFERESQTSAGNFSLIEPYFISAMLFSGERKNIALALRALDKIRCAGIVDPVEGGVVLNSADAATENRFACKPLEINAQFLALYAQASAFLHSSNPEKSADFSHSCVAIFNFIENNLRSPHSGLYFTSQTSNFDGTNENFSSLRYEDLVRLFDSRPDLLDFASAYFGVTRKGQMRGTNLLVQPESMSAFCLSRGLSPEAGRQMLAECLGLLREERSAHAGRLPDRKQLLGENALLVSSLLRAAQALGEQRFVERAFALLDELWGVFANDEGFPALVAYEKKAEGRAHASDLAYWLQAYVDAYSTSGLHIYALRARQITKWLHAGCVDPHSGLLYSSAEIDGLPIRPLKFEDAESVAPASIVFSACRTFLAACAANGALEAMDPADVKMFEALELVALCSIACRAHVSPVSCSALLTSVRWALNQNVCTFERTEPASLAEWCHTGPQFWRECIAKAGVWCLLSNRPAPRDAGEGVFVAGGDKALDTPHESLALALCNVRDCYSATVKYDEIIELIRVHPSNGG